MAFVMAHFDNIIGLLALCPALEKSDILLATTEAKAFQPVSCNSGVKDEKALQ